MITAQQQITIITLKSHQHSWKSVHIISYISLYFQSNNNTYIMRKIILKLFIVCFIVTIGLGIPRNLQFSHHVQGYLPNQFPLEFSLYLDSTGNPIDPYIITGPFSTVLAYGSTARNATLVIDCLSPLKLISGACQCPNSGRYMIIEGRAVCLGRTVLIVEEPQCSIQNVRPNQLSSSSIASLAKIFRQYDGKQNNEQFPNWGGRDTPLHRLTNSYLDEIQTPINLLRTPRFISNRIGSFSPNKIPTNRLNLSIGFTLFGQFIDHDIGLTEAQHPQFKETVEYFNITIPLQDSFFGNISYIPFTRSQYMPDQAIRTFPNMITTWIDGSQIYGSSAATSCLLRAFTNGKLKTSGDNLLPIFQGFFRAGDIRAMQNLVLVGYHTIFMREHNRICDQLKSQNPALNDQELFQAARNYVIGLLQKIVSKDFLPILLGDKYKDELGDYKGYNPSINPTLPLEFTTAGYRIGHALLTSRFKRVNIQRQEIGQFRLNDLFFNPTLINNQNIDDVFRGISYTPTKQRSPRIIDDVRNLLVVNRNKQSEKLDLFALNLQRSRDHGIGSYNQVREAYGLPKIQTFDQILLGDKDSLIIALELERIYTTPDQVELWIGIIGERSVNNGIVGQLGAKLIGQGFRNIRDGDRYWYQNAYPQNIIDKIDATTLSDIIRRNTGVQNIADNFFYLSQ